MTTVSINGTSLFYRITGSGVPCLVMHGGFGLDHHLLWPWLDPLGDTLQLIYYDHRCHGLSGRPPLSTLTFEQLSRDADALRGHLGHERIAVLGFSSGGYAAIEYTLRSPQRVSHLILVSTSPAWELQDIAAQAARKGATPEQVSVLAQLESIRSDGNLREAFRTLLPLYFFHYSPEIGEQLIAPIHFSAATFTHGLQLLKGYSRAGDLKDITAPTLVIAGQDDFIQPAYQSERLHNGLPHSRLVIFEHSGHFPFIEEPEAFFRVVRSWLAGSASH